MASVRRLGAALAIAIVAITALASTTLANGIGDLYVASPAGVLETRVDTQAVVNTVPVAPAPVALAFSNDGRSLFTVSGGRHIASIDIETISLKTQRDVPQNAVAIAVPKGGSVIVAYPSTRTLGTWDPADDSLRDSPVLPGGPDLLAGDRRDARVVAARSGASWVAAWDPSTAALQTTTVGGSVTAIAVDRDHAAAFVATRSPNKLYHLTLPSLAIDWSTALPATPTGVAVSSGGAFVAGSLVGSGAGSVIWSVGPKGALPWATPAGPVHQLIASDEGTVVYAAESNRVEAFTSAGKVARSLSLSGDHAPTSVAPVPHASSIATGAAAGGSGGPHGTVADVPVPPTDTAGDDTVAAIAHSPLIGLAVAVSLAVFAVTFVLARRHVGRQLDH